jgi:hypothetical protein
MTDYELDGNERINSRTERALTQYLTVLADVGQVKGADDLFLVVSQSGTEYLVDRREGRCTCPDHEHRGVRCKHLWRVAFATSDEPVPPPALTTSTHSLASTPTRRHAGPPLTAAWPRDQIPRTNATAATSGRLTVTVATGTPARACRVGPVIGTASKSRRATSSHDHRAERPAPAPERGGGRGEA